MPRDVITTISIETLTDTIVALHYGPAERTKLVFNAVDAHGQPLILELGRLAMSQLSRALRDIDSRFPGAMGHH